MRTAAIMASLLLPLSGQALHAEVMGLAVDEQESGYLFRYFADSADVHVWSHFGHHDLILSEERSLAVQWHFEEVTIPGSDAPAGSSEEVDAVTSASRPLVDSADIHDDFRKYRNEFTAGYDMDGTSFGYYVSLEKDYFAQQLKASLGRDFMNRNLNLASGVGFGWDNIKALDDGSGGGDTRHKNSTFWNLTATQVLDPKTILRAGMELNLVRGLQHNLYRSVYAGGAYLPENHPDSRLRSDLFFKLNRYLANRSALRLDYRFYQDDWGIRSHTIGAKLSQYITEFAVLRYRYRHYRQNAADFWREEYLLAEGVDGHRSADYRIGVLRAHLFGGRLQFDLDGLAATAPFLAGLDLSMSYERYFNSNNFSANVFETQLTYSF